MSKLTLSVFLVYAVFRAIDIGQSNTPPGISLPCYKDKYYNNIKVLEFFQDFYFV